MEFKDFSAIELAAMIREGDAGVVEVTQYFIDRIEKINNAVNAFVELNFDYALYQAKEIERLKSKGSKLGQLAGIPVAIKDTEDVRGFKTTYGSMLLKDVKPARGDSDLVKRLKAAGAIIVGKTNTSEFAYAPDTYNMLYGITSNPRNLKKSPGGSSGGSAVAVLTSMVPLASGSDGGGSIRIPSCLCGLPGFKPSLGRVPVSPGVPSWFDLSSKGILGKNLKDITYALDAVIGPEQGDLYSLPLPETPWFGAFDELGLPKTIAFSFDLGYAPVDNKTREAFKKALDKISDQKIELIEVSPFEEDPVASWLVLSSSYNYREMKKFSSSPQRENVDPNLKFLVESASKLTAQDLIDAYATSFYLNSKLVKVFQKARILLTPTVAGLWPDSMKPGTINGEEDVNWVRFTYPFNMTRSPAATIPIAFLDDNMPVGIQIIGPQHADVAVIRAAASLEQIIDLPDEEKNRYEINL